MSDYTDAVERGLEGMRYVSFGPIYDGGCPECDECDFSEDVGDEGSFSWRGCGICGSTLGGTHYAWHWVDENDEVIHEHDGCVDCLLYLSNGDEPEDWNA